MASNFPAGTDTLTNPLSTDITNVVDHAQNHTNANNAVMAVQSNMGTNSGTNIHKNFVAGNFPVRQNSTNVFQNVMQGTIGTSIIQGGTFANGVGGTTNLQSPTITVSSDAQGDVWFRSAGGTVKRLGPGISGQILSTGGAAADPSWVTQAAKPLIVTARITTNGTTASSSYVDVAGLTVTGTTTVTSNIMVVANGNWLNGGVNSNFLQVLKNGTALAVVEYRASNANFSTNFNLTYMDMNVGAGTYTYKAQLKVDTGTATVQGAAAGGEDSGITIIAYPA